jgi:hypothetical protein
MAKLRWLVLVLVVVLASPALAHDVSQTDRVWKSGDKCLKLTSVIGHRNDGPDYDMWFEVWVFTLRDYTAGLTYVCGVEWNRPIEHIRLTWYLQKKRADGSIFTCDERGAWVYNNGETYTHFRWYNIEDVTPCGEGDYRLKARGQTYHNGAWRPSSGSLVSPWHHYQGNG